MTTPESKDVASAVVLLKEKKQNILSNHAQFETYMNQSQEILTEYLSLIENYFSSTLQWVDLVDRLSKAILEKNTSEENNLTELFAAIEEFQEKTIDMKDLNERLTNITKLQSQFNELQEKLKTSTTSVDSMVEKPQPGMIPEPESESEPELKSPESEDTSTQLERTKKALQNMNRIKSDKSWMQPDSPPLGSLELSQKHDQYDALRDALAPDGGDLQLGGGKKTKLKKKLKHKLNKKRKL